jgi:single-strand DNA-binding protein
MSTTSINHVVLTGHLTRDPDLRVLPSGSSVCDLRIAVNARRRDSGTGEWGDKPNYFDVVVFGSRGENVAKYMHKGRPVAVDGRLDWRSWETKDGRSAQAVSVIAETVQFLGDPPSDTHDVVENGDINGDEDALDWADEDALTTAASKGYQQ